MIRDYWISDICDYLTGNTELSQVFIGELPSNEQEGVVITPSGGKEHNLGTTFAMKVTSRFRSFESAIGFAYLIHSLLSKTGNIDQGQTRIVYSKSDSVPFSLGRDKNGMARVVCNYQLEIAP